MNSEQDLYVTRNISVFFLYRFKTQNTNNPTFTPIKITLYISSIDKCLKKDHMVIKHKEKYFLKAENHKIIK